jgi:hypothetical protein
MSPKIPTTMTYQEAKKIIDIIDKNASKNSKRVIPEIAGEYLLVCKFCGEFETWETDAPIEKMIDMAKKHKSCLEKWERKHG